MRPSLYIAGRVQQQLEPWYHVSRLLHFFRTKSLSGLSFPLLLQRRTVLDSNTFSTWPCLRAVMNSHAPIVTDTGPSWSYSQIDTQSERTPDRKANLISLSPTDNDIVDSRVPDMSTLAHIAICTLHEALARESPARRNLAGPPIENWR